MLQHRQITAGVKTILPPGGRSTLRGRPYPLPTREDQNLLLKERETHFFKLQDENPPCEYMLAYQLNGLKANYNRPPRLH